MGLSIVGVQQFKHTIRGYRYIRQAQKSVGDERKRLIDEHRKSMVRLYACGADTGRGDAAAATWIFGGDESRRRRDRDVDVPSRPVRTSGTTAVV